MHFRSQRKLQGEGSLADWVGREGGGNGLSRLHAIKVDDTMREDRDARDACARARRCVDRCLEGREAMVIRLRYGLDRERPLTQREIAARCGISRSYVSRIEKKALGKLRAAMEEE